MFGWFCGDKGEYRLFGFFREHNGFVKRGRRVSGSVPGCGRVVDISRSWCRAGDTTVGATIVMNMWMMVAVVVDPRVNRRPSVVVDEDPVVRSVWV